MAMSERHKKLLIANRLSLIKNVHLSVEFFAHLTVDKSLTPAMQEEIEVLATKQARVGKLLDLLPMRPARAFDTFLHALVDTDQEHLAAQLDYQRTLQMVQTRDHERQSPSGFGGGSVQASNESKSEPTSFAPSGVANPSVVCSQNRGAFLPSSSTHTSSFQNQSSGKSCVLPPSTGMGTSSQLAGTGSSQPVQPCPNMVPSASSGSGTGSLTSAQQCTSMEVSPDEIDSDIVNYLKTERENLQIFDRDHLKSESPPSGHQAVKNGLALIIGNGTRNGQELLNIRISGCALSQMFETLGFETEEESNLTADGIIRLLSKYASMQSPKYDAFVLIFIGFGRQDGTIYGSDGKELSTTNAILPMFTASKCPAFNGKPKIFLFQLAQQDTNPVDIVDANLNPPQNEALWSDLIVFAAVTVVAVDMFTDENQSKLNLMYRALIKVTSKFVHQLPFTDILQKVRAILLCQDIQGISGLSIQSPPIFISPGSRPVYLQKC